MRYLGVLAVALLLAGCSASRVEPSPTDPYRSEFEQAIATSSSDFVKEILADHTITPAELAESQNSVFVCLQDTGFYPLVTTDDGRRMVNIPADAGPECTDAWDGGIEQLYWTIRTNPYHADMNELVAACFVRLDLVPADFTGGDLQDLLDQEVSSYRQLADGTKVDEVPAQNPGGSAFPSGMMIHAPETQGCWASPLTTGFS